MQYKTTPSGLVIVSHVESRAEAQARGKKEYLSKHCRCPQCGGNEFESNCLGRFYDWTDPDVKDTLESTCTTCGWHGIEHDKVGDIVSPKQVVGDYRALVTKSRASDA